MLCTSFVSVFGMLSAVAVVGIVCAVYTQSAQATTYIHHYEAAPSNEISKGVPAGCGKGEESPPCVAGVLGFPEAMTVDSGRLLVGEVAGQGHDRRLDSFSASSGKFEAQLARSERKAGEPGGSPGVAVGDEAKLIYLGAPRSVGVFSEEGTLLSTWTGAGVPGGGGAFASVQAVAVDNHAKGMEDLAGGDLYVADGNTNAGELRVVDVFAPALAPGFAEQAPVKVLRGTCPTLGSSCSVAEEEEHPFGHVAAVAVNPATGVVLIADNSVVDVFKPGLAGGEYVFEQQITGTPEGPFPGGIASLAVNGAGDLYAAVGTSVYEFALTGSAGEASEYVGRITETTEGPFEEIRSIAVNPESGDLFVADFTLEGARVDVFGPNVSVPGLITKPATGVGPFAATLNGEVNPEKLGTSSCDFIWGTSPTELTRVLPCKQSVPEGSSLVPVSEVLEGLAPDTTYYYRLQATAGGNENPGEAGEVQEFTTQGPAIQAAVSDVASTSATFGGSVTPHGASTSAYIEYGRCASATTCSTSGWEAQLPAAPGTPLGEGSEPVELAPHHIQGLTAEATYHYRVIAISYLEGTSQPPETFAGPELTFSTPPAASWGRRDWRITVSGRWSPRPSSVAP